MTEIESTELFQQDGKEFRSIRLSIDNDGAIRLECQDMGPIVRESWDEDEYEFWITVPNRALAKLAFVLLREKYMGRDGSVDELRSFCEKERIEHKFMNWV